MPDSDYIYEEISEEQSLAEHKRLSNLYITNRFAFELERKRLIREFMKKIPCPMMRARIQGFQNELDRVLKGAGSDHNRFVMMQVLFWNCVNKDFIPALKTLHREIASGVPKRRELYHHRFGLPESAPARCKPHLRLLRTRKD